MVDDTWANAALDQLDRLTGPHIEKKRATIIALVDAKLAGNDEESVWLQSQTCSRNIWHEKWKKDSLIADVLTQVTAIARRHRDSAPVRALAKAGERIALAAPLAAEQLVNIATTGRVKRVRTGENGKPLITYEEAAAAVILSATTALLDRAGRETASKRETTIIGDSEQPLTAQVNHAIDSETAGTIFDILAAVGALTAADDDAAADELHSTQPDA